MHIKWLPDGHNSRFEYSQLLAKAFPEPKKKQPAVLWDAALEENLVWESYKDIKTDTRRLAAWLESIQQYGFALLRNVPARSGRIAEVVKLFGYLRETNYGRIFNVRSEVNPANLAFTSLALSPHTDNPYRKPVPTLQLLHCLRSDVSGGDSVLVDGFQVAQQLKKHHRVFFELLANTPVTYRYEDENDLLETETTIIGLDVRSEVEAIRFNNRSLSKADVNPFLIKTFYQAYHRLSRMIFDPVNQVVFSMRPGDLFIVDNERVLHGRTGFSASGNRLLQGCYADRDGLLSKLEKLRKENED